MKMQGFTAAGVLVLAIGAGAIGGIVSGGGDSSPPATPPAIVQIDGVNLEAEPTEAPSVAPSPTSAPEVAESTAETAASGPSASDDAQRAEDAAERAETAAERAEQSADEVEEKPVEIELPKVEKPEPKVCDPKDQKAFSRYYVCDAESGEWVEGTESLDYDATVCGDRKRSALPKASRTSPDLACATYPDGSQAWETRPNGGEPVEPTEAPEPDGETPA